MAKTKISEFDATASNNTDINSVNVAEGCPPSGINNAIREMASLLKKQEVGTDAMTSPDIDGGTIDGATIGGSSGVTIGVSDGTVSAPSIKFTSDTNTGIYRGGTDILKFVTAGTDAITINASQDVTLAGSLNFADSEKAIFGAGSDLEIFSDGGTFSYINNTQGVLRIRNTSDDQDVVIQSDNGSGGVTDYFMADGSSGEARLFHYGSEKLNTTSTGIDVTGNVDISTGQLDLDANYRVRWGASNDYSIMSDNANYIQFNTAGSEAMRISSGNLLVGTTDSNTANNNANSSADNGIVAQAGGQLHVAQYQSTAGSGSIAFFNRTGTDGNIITLKKSGTDVGSIGVTGSGTQPYLVKASTGGFKIGNDGSTALLLPVNADGSNSDGGADLGASTNRFKDLYLSGTIEIQQGNNNVAVGKGSMANNTGQDNTALGVNSLVTNASNGSNTAIGSHALYASTGAENTAVGRQALRFNASGEGNTSVGYASGFTQSGSGADRNTFVGRSAGYGVTTGNSNTFVGSGTSSGGSGETMTTGSKNSIFGAFNGNQGGLDIRTSDNNIVLSDGDGNPRQITNSSGFSHWTTNISDSDRATVALSHAIHSDVIDNVALFVENSSANPYGIFIDFSDASPDDNSKYFLKCEDGSDTGRLIIYSDGDVVNHDNSYGSISDVKLKEQITDASSQWEDIKALTVRKYKMKSDVATGDSDAHWRLGLIAQEVETAGMNGLIKDNPDMIENEDGQVVDSGTTTKSIKYSVLYMKAVKALQEAMERIETLEAKVTALENG